MHNYGNFPVWQCNSKTFNFSNEYISFDFVLHLSTISPGNYFGFQGNSTKVVQQEWMTLLRHQFKSFHSQRTVLVGKEVLHLNFKDSFSKLVLTSIRSHFSKEFDSFQCLELLKIFVLQIKKSIYFMPLVHEKEKYCHLGIP